MKPLKTILIVFCTSCLFLCNIALATEFNKRALEVFNVKQRTFELTGSQKIERETGRLVANYQEYFKSNKTEAIDIAWEYLNHKKDVYGLNDLNDIKVAESIRTPGGRYVYFKQELNGIPIFGTNFTVYIDDWNTVKYVLNEFIDVSVYNNVATRATLSSSEALQVAKNHLSISRTSEQNSRNVELVYFESDRGLELTWKINVFSEEVPGSWEFFISATDNRIIQASDVVMYSHYDGIGMVYETNPIVMEGVDYGYGQFRHNNTDNNATLNNRRVSRSLRDITWDSNKQMKYIYFDW